MLFGKWAKKEGISSTTWMITPKKNKQPAIQDYMWCILSKLGSLFIRLIPAIAILLEIICGISFIILVAHAFIFSEVSSFAGAAAFLFFLGLVIFFTAGYKGKFIKCQRFVFRSINTRPGITSYKGMEWIRMAGEQLPEDVNNLLSWQRKYKIKELTFITHEKFFRHIKKFFSREERKKIEKYIKESQPNEKSIKYKNESGVKIEISRVENRKNLLYAASANIFDPEDVAKRCCKLPHFKAKIINSCDDTNPIQIDKNEWKEIIDESKELEQ